MRVDSQLEEIYGSAEPSPVIGVISRAGNVIRLYHKAEQQPLLVQARAQISDEAAEIAAILLGKGRGSR